MNLFDRMRDALFGSDAHRAKAETGSLQGTADNRGLFGYKRRAHGGDPNAKYGFENDPNAGPTLPPSSPKRPG
jgi:hypothetical protein